MGMHVDLGHAKQLLGEAIVQSREAVDTVKALGIQAYAYVLQAAATAKNVAVGGPWWQTVLLGLAAVVLLLWYYGVLRRHQFKRCSLPSFYLLYREHIGPYKDVGPVFQAVADVLNEKNIEFDMMGGIYFDDPSDGDRCRSFCGAMLEADDQTKVDLELFEGHLEALDVHVLHVPAGEYARAEFPLRVPNMLSYILATVLLYPRLRKQFLGDLTCGTVHGTCGSFEIYDHVGKQIHVCAPLNNHATFTHPKDQ
ncbi:MAG: hypothetical protein MHM6MM_002145 [Cercozoa sp. M6MM]